MSERDMTQPAVPKLDEGETSAREAANVQTSTPVERDVLAEGERSVAIGQAEGSIINTGDVHINVGQQNIYNINPAAEDPAGTNITSDFGAALSLVKLNQSLSSELARRIASELEEAREAFREGATREAFQRVQAIRASENWPALDDSLRGLVLRVLAHMTLGLKNRNGVAEARAYVNEAEQVDPAGDALMINACLKVFEEGYDAALVEIGTPTTLDAFNLRVGILIEKNEIEEALRALRLPPDGVVLDAESHRLYALTLLAARDLDGAQKEIDKARAERPKRQIVRLGAAVIDYYSSLSPMALQSQLFPYPHPVHPSMVKRDADSQSRLARAAEEFGRVAAQMERGSNSQKELKVWQIACTANIPEREPEASELCKVALSEDPCDFRVLSWVHYRNYDVDLSNSRTALEQALHEGEDGEKFRIHEILALVSIYLKGKTPDKVLSLLERHRRAFDASGHSDLWWYWRGQALIADGQAQTALDESKHIQERSLRGVVTASALGGMGRASGDYQPLITYLEEAYAESADGELMIQLCELKAQTGDWNFAAAHAEEYCDLIGTAPAAYFAVSAAWNAQRPELCLELLDKYEHLFPDNTLPDELRRLRVNCRLRTGDVGEALAEAEQLTRESDSVANVFTLMDVLRAKGDFAGIVAAARRLRRRRDVDAPRLLRIAGLIKLEDPDLAREFWQGAKDEALSDPLLAAYAIDLAFKLGLDREVGPLMGQMYELAESGEGVFQMVSVEQLLEMMSENRKHLDQVHELYKRGDAPLSLVAQRTKRTLADIFNGLADENQAADNPHARPRILIRHGARLLLPPENFQHSDKWRLHLDVTALLLADHLGILNKIEETFKPLYVSGKISTALHTERNELLDSQQSRFDNYRAILRLVEQGKLRVLEVSSPAVSLDTIGRALEDAQDAWHSAPPDAAGSAGVREGAQSEPIAGGKGQYASDGEVKPGGAPRPKAAVEELMAQLGENRSAMLSSAYDEDGFTVGFLPLQGYGQARQTPIELPASLKNRVINGRSVVDSLLGHDHISDQAAGQALRALGHEANPEASSVSPLTGAKLFLMQGMAELLAGAGMLEPACDSFGVAVSVMCVEEARAALREYERLSAIEGRVRKLAKRISDGIEDGTYKFIRVSDARRQETDEVDESENPDFVSTLDLFRYEPVQWDVLWIDDRAVNKHPFRDGAPIVGANEVLLALRQREVIDKHLYYELLLKLRAQNFRYIPIDEDEIIYHLNKAQVRGGSVVESDPLSVLRRYLASSLLDKDYFQNDPPPAGSPNPLGEWPFVTQSLMAITDAIAAVWADERVSEETAGARADWILNNLYAGLFGCRHLRRRGDDEADDSLTLIAKDIAGLMLKAIGVGGDLREPEQSNQRRKSYFSWLMGRLVYPRFRSDPTALLAVAQEIRRILCDFGRAQFESPQQGVASQLILQRLYMDLPQEVRREVNLDPSTSEWLGLETIQVIAVGGLKFKKEDFFKAVELALANAEATISSHDPEAEYRFVAAEDEAGGGHDPRPSPPLAILDARGNQVGLFRDPLFGLLSPDPEMRLVVLKWSRPWFDCSQEDFEKEAREIAETPDPQQRVERARSWQQQSCEFFYQELERKFRLQEGVYTLDLTTPSARGLLRRFRLPPSFAGSFSATWDEATRSILADEGVAAAIERAACLPVAMSGVLADAFGGLPQDEKRTLLQRLSSQMPSPLPRLHLANLALRTAGDDEGINALARSILTDLYDDRGMAGFAAFEALLKFVNQEFGSLKGAEGWSPQTKLAMIWAHATRLHSMLLAVGHSAEGLAPFFMQEISPITAETLLRKPDLWDDSLHPHRINHTVFLTHGVAKAFAGIGTPTLERAGAIGLIREQTFVEVSGGEVFPNVLLLRDSALYSDGLESLFGGDRFAALAPVLGEEGVEILASENLKALAEQALDELLKDQNNFGAWAQLFAILGGLPIYPELREKCGTVLQSLDVERMFTADPSGTQLALSVAAKQIRHAGNEALHSRFHENILRVVRLEVENPEAANPDERPRSGDTSGAVNENLPPQRIALLLDVVLILSIVPGDLRATGTNIAAMMERIASVWEEFGQHFGDTILGLAWKLPANALTGWWPLLLKLRTSMKNGL